MSRAAEVSEFLRTHRRSWLPQVFKNGRATNYYFELGDAEGTAGDSLKVPWSHNKAGLRDFGNCFAGDDLDLLARGIGGNIAEAIRYAEDKLGAPCAEKPIRRTATKPKAPPPRPAEPPKPNGAAVPDPPARHPELGEPTFRYDYTDAAGRLIFYHCRFDPPGRRKEFRPLSFKDGRWQWRDPEGLLPLYGLAELAARPDDPVLLVEGEKAADVARDLLPRDVVITWPHGAKAIDKIDWSPLAGRQVVIWPDHDEAGAEAVPKIAAALRQAGAASVRAVELPPGLPDAWDLADELPDGWDLDRVEYLIGTARELPAPGDEACPPLLSAAAFVAGYVAPAYLIDGLVQQSRVYSLTGPTGHGKTAVALSLAVHKALGRALAGRRIDPGRVVYLAGENPDDIRGRVILMAARMGLDLDALPLSFVAGTFDLTSGLPKLAERVAAIGSSELVVVDTGAAFLAASDAADENDNLALLRFALELRKITELPGNPTALALMHPTKYAAKDNLLPRGGGAFLNEMDGNVTVWAEGDRETTELGWAGKLRGPSFEPITFALETGTCPALVDAAGRSVPTVWAYPASTERAEQATARRRSDEDSVLLIMAEAPDGSFASWATGLGWLLQSGEPAKQRVYRAVQRLADDKLVAKKRDRWLLTNAGDAEAKRLRGEAP